MWGLLFFFIPPGRRHRAVIESALRKSDGGERPGEGGLGLAVVLHSFLRESVNMDFAEECVLIMSSQERALLKERGGGGHAVVGARLLLTEGRRCHSECAAAN